MLMDVPYLQQRGGTWRYRRKVPAALRKAVGKPEILFPLGSTKDEALRNYAKVRAKAERLLAEAKKPRPIPLTPTTHKKAAPAKK